MVERSCKKFFFNVFPFSLSLTDMISIVTEILKLDMSINLYMFHGGTNFGFMSGAFAVGIPASKPMVTSYGMCSITNLLLLFVLDLAMQFSERFD